MKTNVLLENENLSLIVIQFMIKIPDRIVFRITLFYLLRIIDYYCFRLELTSINGTVGF